MTNYIDLTYTQCKQLIDNGHDLRETVENLNDQPEWLVNMSPVTELEGIQAILHGGCSSGAYMPAVTYHTASQTMAAHGDDILEYIENNLGDLPNPPKGSSWSGIAVHYCSLAVELWCGQFLNIMGCMED